MSDGNESLRRYLDQRDYERRTIVPCVVETVKETPPVREQRADSQTAIADLQAGQAEDTGITPDVPVLNFSGGGFFVLLPVAQGDELLGQVSDRATGDWVTARNAGEANPVNGKRSKVLTDMLATQFQITAPSGAPATWDHLVIGGPNGEAIELDSDGTVTITGQGVGTATVVINPGGSIDITAGPASNININVDGGSSVNGGGLAAVALAKAQTLTSAIDALLAAGAAAGTGAPGTTGTLAFNAATAVWNGLKSGIATLKMKGE